MLNNLADHPKGQAAIDEWTAGAQKIIDQVKAAGAKRVVWMTSPPPSDNLAECDQSVSATPSQCVHLIDPADTWSLVADGERIVAQHTGITLLDTQLFLCATNDYWLFAVDGVAVRASVPG